MCAVRAGHPPANPVYRTRQASRLRWLLLLLSTGLFCTVATCMRRAMCWKNLPSVSNVGGFLAPSGLEDLRVTSHGAGGVLLAAVMLPRFAWQGIILRLWWFAVSAKWLARFWRFSHWVTPCKPLIPPCSLVTLTHSLCSLAHHLCLDCVLHVLAGWHRRARRA